MKTAAVRYSEDIRPVSIVKLIYISRGPFVERSNIFSSHGLFAASLKTLTPVLSFMITYQINFFSTTFRHELYQYL